MTVFIYLCLFSCFSTKLQVLKNKTLHSQIGTTSQSTSWNTLCGVYMMFHDVSWCFHMLQSYGVLCKDRSSPFSSMLTLEKKKNGGCARHEVSHQRDINSYSDFTAPNETENLVNAEPGFACRSFQLSILFSWVDITPYPSKL